MGLPVPPSLHLGGISPGAPGAPEDVEGGWDSAVHSCLFAWLFPQQREDSSGAMWPSLSLPPAFGPIDAMPGVRSLQVPGPLGV